jgi:hypothetical protein
MTNDMKVGAEVNQAADLAVALAQTCRRMTSDPDYYLVRGGLGFGYTIGTSGQMTIDVGWHGERRLRVIQPAQADLPRLVIPFEGDAAWIKELADAVEDLT